MKSSHISKFLWKKKKQIKNRNNINNIPKDNESKLKHAHHPDENYKLVIQNKLKESNEIIQHK
jgi:hypothetical protein